MVTAGVIGAGTAGRAVAAHAARFARARIAGTTRSRVTTEGVLVTTLESAAVADVVFLAVRSRTVPAVGRRVGNWTGKIVVDVTNARPGDRTGAETDSERVLRLLPGVRLVKALNALPGQVLAESAHRGGGRRVVFLAGDDERANDTVTDLIQSWGFAVIDVGRLHDGGLLLQPGGPLFGLVARVTD